MDSAETSRPAFFEVYAANHLSSALRPAFRFALEVLSVRHPLLIRIAARSDEIFTGLLLILETSQLNKESALLGESFYSLKRSRGLKHTGLQEVPLSRKQLLFSVVFSVIVPHFKAKLDTWYSDITGGAPTDFFDESDPGQGFPPQEQQTFSQLPSRLSSRARHAPLGPLQKFRQLLKAVERLLSSRSFQSTVLEWYPYISTACESLDLLFNILYLFGHSRHFNLALALQGLVLRRKSTLEAMTSQSQKTPFFPHGSRSFDLAQVLSAASERLLTAFKAGFFVGVFAFRFLQYYYAAEDSAPRASGPVIPPPENLLPASGVDRKSAMASGSCPLCNRTRVNPTACTTSGYVFCYMCIFTHLQQSDKCPVTLAPTQIEDLVRVYDDANSN